MNPLVIPTPKTATFNGQIFPATSPIVIRCTSSWIGAAEILKVGLQKSNLSVTIRRTRQAGLTIGEPIKTLTAPNQAEGYAVSVTDRGIALVANDAAGRIWAVQTLLQLFRGDGFFGTEIRDWPSLAFRGAHLFHGPQARPFHEKLIDRVFSPFKMNGIVVQGDTIGWTLLQKGPEHVGSLADVRAEAIHARRMGIDAFPLIPSHGHMWWLLGSGREKFREDPDSNWAINVTDTDAMKLLESIHDEAASVFGSKNHHLGLDEVIDPVTPRGRVPYRSKLTFAELFAINVAVWTKWGKKRRKRLWIWADMLMHPSEVKPAFGTAPTVADARYLRQKLSKELVVVDWQYSSRPRYPSLDLLRAAGYRNRVIATWFDREGINAFSRAAVANGALGGLQTTWCGYESAESVLDGPERRQFVAMVAAAEAFWTGGIAPSWNPTEIFDRVWAGKRLND